MSTTHEPPRAALPRATEFSFILNGREVTGRADAETKLLEVLREQLGIISAKDGCMPQGQCGCCTVLVEGNPKVSCAVPALQAAGKRVLTLEGVSAEEREKLTQAFVAAGGLQCGFCIPGIAMRAKWLLDKDPACSRAEIAKAIDVHLCRCTGYQKILDAIELAGRAWRGEPLPALDWSARIGSSLPRWKGVELAFGERPYIDDMKVDGLVHGALVQSKTPRALFRGIDPSAALALPGVIAVLTAADVPAGGQRSQGLIYKDWPQLIAPGEEVRCVGDTLAIVVAESRSLARRAAELVKVDLEPRPPVLTTHDALAPGAPRVHPDHENLLSRSTQRRGDVEAAKRASAHVVSGVFRTQAIEHAFLEPESALAIPLDDGSMLVYSPGQGVFDDRRQIASFLGMPLEQVKVELVANGGAFGGKEDLGVQCHAALAAKVLGRPCRVTLSRVESIYFHPKRHPIEMHYEAGCDADGRLTFVRAKMYGDKGAYASVGTKVLERACGHATGAYKVPNVEIEALAVYTNNPPCGAMRGFGANQAAFAIEGCLDMLAEKCGLDGWEIRYRNALGAGDRFGTGQLLKHSVGLKATLEAVRDVYRSAKYAGIACGIKNVGIGNGMPDAGEAVLEVEPSGDAVTIHTGFTEMGQGLFTVLIQMAAHVTGIDPRKFRAVASTAKPTPCGMTTASRGTLCGGNPVIAAAEKLKAALAEVGGDLKKLAGREFLGVYRYDKTNKLEDNDKVEEPITHLTFGYATQVVILDDEGKLAKVVAAHDVGRVINRQLLEGQIEGSVHMGLGFALTEDLAIQGGIPKNTTLRSLGILRAKDMPPVEVIFIEDPEPEGPFGAKGVGEIGLVPTAGAVAGALYAYDKVRRTTLPMKDAPAARAILRGRK